MQVFLQHDSGCIISSDQGLIPALHLFEAHLDHGLGGHLRGIAFVDRFDRHGGKLLFQPFDDLLQPAAWHGYRISIPVLGLADDDEFHRFFRKIVFRKAISLGDSNSGKPRSNDLQGIGNCNTGTSKSVVYEENARAMKMVSGEANW